MSAANLTRGEPKRQRGDVIRHLRKRRGRRGTEFARSCGISPGTLYNIESGTGNAGWPTLYAIAAQLRVPVTKLLRDPTQLPPAPDAPKADAA